MGHYARLSPDFSELTENDAARLAQAGLAEDLAADVRRTGLVMHNGRSFAFTLDTTHMAPELHRIMPEQFAIAALLLASFIAPLWHLLG